MLVVRSGESPSLSELFIEVRMYTKGAIPDHDVAFPAQFLGNAYRIGPFDFECKNASPLCWILRPQYSKPITLSIMVHEFICQKAVQFVLVGANPIQPNALQILNSLSRGNQGGVILDPRFEAFGRG